MTSQHSDASDDGPSTLDLLWGVRGRPRRGPRPKLDLDAVLDAAIGVADAEGLEAVTMQRVARELGFTTMSLYRYVQGKEQLVELMTDAALDAAPEPPGGAGWRDELRGWARAMYAALLRRPWLLYAQMYGPPRGPRQLSWLEAAAGPLRRAGLGAEHTMAVASYLSISVMGMARVAAELRQVHEESGATHGQLDAGYTGVLRRAASTGRYPAIGALLAEEGPDGFGPPPEEGEAGAFGDLGPDLDFAVERLLDGVEAFTSAPADRKAPDGGVGADDAGHG